MQNNYSKNQLTMIHPYSYVPDTLLPFKILPEETGQPSRKRRIRSR